MNEMLRLCSVAGR